MVNENVSRKIDNAGRIVIPKHLRNKLNFTEGKEVEYFTTKRDGKIYICMALSEEEEDS
jgi:AbrB family looped-hinge helix DNA binding protein